MYYQKDFNKKNEVGDEQTWIRVGQITSLVLTVIRKQNKNGQKTLFPRDFDSFFRVQGNKLRDYIKYGLYTHIYGKLKLAILSPGKQFQRYILRFLN